MNSKVKSLRIVCCVLLSLMLCLMTSCFDLGGHKSSSDEHDFDEYYKDYLNCFDKVYFLNQALDKTSYNYKKSFFNKECVNETRTWTSNEDCVSYDEYAFIYFSASKGMEVVSISMYLKGNELEDNVTVTIYLYKMSSFKSDDNYATYNIWKQDKAADDNADLSDYDALNVDDALSSRNMTLSNSWDSFTMTFFEKGNSELSSPLEVKNGDTFVLMIKNNMGIGLEDDMTKVSFCATNLLVAMPSED